MSRDNRHLLQLKRNANNRVIPQNIMFCVKDDNSFGTKNAITINAIT